MFSRLALISPLVAAMALVDLGASTAAQDKKAGDSKSKHVVVVAQYRPAGDLASVLAKQLHNVADFQILADAPSNALLLSGNPAAVDEVLNFLAKLDRRPQEMIFDVLILHIASRKGTDGKLEPDDVDEKAFSGTAARVLDAVKQLEKKGLVTSSRHLQLKAIENQTADLKETSSKPYITGITNSGGGGKGGKGGGNFGGGAPTVSRTVAYRTEGTTIKLTPVLGADRVISLQLKLNDDRSAQPEDGIPIGTDENGAPVRATEFVTTVIDTNLQLISGQAILARDVRMSSKLAGERTLVVVIAELIK